MVSGESVVASNVGLGSHSDENVDGGADNLGDALAVLAHEIRGRLHGLILTTDAVRRRARDDSNELSRAWLLETTERQAAVIQRLRHVLDMVLTAYRATTGELRPSRESTDLREVVQAAIGLEAETLRAARCECALDAPVPIFGFWDRLQLELAIANLVNNAAKYGGGQPVEVRVRAYENTAQVHVSDHGIGIRPDDLPRLFCRFSRLEQGAGSIGIGLGLWFAKCVAVAHGGDLDASSAPGAGASFTLRVPLGNA